MLFELGAIDHELARRCFARITLGSGRPGPLVVRPWRCTLAGRRDVIRLTAELVVRDDHHRVLRARALVDRTQQLDEVIAPAHLACVTGMLVLEANWLDEADRVEHALLVRCRHAARNSASSRRCVRPLFRARTTRSS